MSLVTSASPWVNDTSNNKKRQPTLRNTHKQPINIQSFNEVTPEPPSERSELQHTEPSSFDDAESVNKDRTSRVNSIIDKITMADNTNNGSSKMGDFKPLEHPTINVKRDIGDNSETPKYIPDMPSYLNAGDRMKNGGLVYGADDTKSAVFSNYNKSYEQPATFNKPYYANMGIGNSGFGSGYNDGKLMEKINYMIHMLEEQQLEKTNNITEEFILYSFLGIFVIYLCDSFARSGKYTR